MDNAQCKTEYINEQLLAEYAALRKEIDTLSKSRHQLIIFNLTILGGILALSSKNISIFAMFAYPWMSFIFAVGWSNYHFRMGEIGRYIKDNLETKAEGLNWESSFRRNAPRSWRMTERFALGVFCGSPFIVMIFMILDYIDFIPNPSLPKTENDFASITISILVCLIFFVVPCYLSYKNIGRRRRSEFINRWVSIATPIRNAKEGSSKDYINRIIQLTKDVNEFDDPQIKESVIRSTNVTIVSNTKYSVKNISTLHISFYKMSDSKKEKIPMAKWWYKSINNAFMQDSFIEWFKKKTFLKAVLYYPVDVCWERSHDNTVSEPKRVRDFIKAILAEDGECLWLGTYTSKKYKDAIEDQV